MEETKNQVLEDAAKEIKEANEEELKATIEKWFESTRTDGMRIGAYYISASIYGAIRKNLNKAGKISLNDYRRCIKDITKIIDVQLITEQNDLGGNADE